jgi:hypothetical protein
MDSKNLNFDQFKNFWSNYGILKRSVMGTVYEIKNRDFSVITEIKFSKKTEIYRDLPRKKNKKYREFRIKIRVL